MNSSSPVASRERISTAATPQLGAGFDRIARLYRWAEYLVLGPALRLCRETYLPQLLHARHALILGDGDGRFLSALLRNNHAVHAVAVDNSAVMLHLLRSRCGTQRVQTLQASAINLELPASPAPDLIATHFFLDCFEQGEVDRLATDLASIAAPQALWVVSDFAVPGRQPWATVSRTIIRVLYLAFQLLTGLHTKGLPVMDKPLSQAGFRLLHRTERLGGLLFSELWILDGPAPETTSAASRSSTQM